MFTKSFELTLNSAYTRAREKKHEFITVEHLLLALVDNSEASEVLLACGANLDRLRAGLAIFVDETTPSLPQHYDRDIQPTISFQRVLQRSISQVQGVGQMEVNGAHALVSIFGEPDSRLQKMAIYRPRRGFRKVPGIRRCQIGKEKDWDC